MHPQPSYPLKFNAGCAVDADIYYMAARLAGGPETSCDVAFGPPSYLFFYQHRTAEKWFYHELLDWQVESVAFIPAGKGGRPRRVCALAEDGRLEDLSRDETQIEQVGPEADHHDFNGGLWRLRLIGGSLFCCGMGGRIYEQTAAGWKQLATHFPDPPEPALTDDDYAEWLEAVLHIRELSQLDASLPAAGSERDQEFRQQFEEAKERQSMYGELIPDIGVSLHDLTGTSNTNLYVVGAQGFIAHWNGETWQIPTPVTSSAIWDARMISPDDVLMVGSDATIILGSIDKGLSLVPLANAPDAEFACACAYDELIYIGSNRGLYTYLLGACDVAQLTTGLPPELCDTDIVDVDSAGGVLWVLTATALGRFDGTSWQVVAQPCPAST